MILTSALESPGESFEISTFSGVGAKRAVIFFSSAWSGRVSAAFPDQMRFAEPDYLRLFSCRPPAIPLMSNTGVHPPANPAVNRLNSDRQKEKNHTHRIDIVRPGIQAIDQQRRIGNPKTPCKHLHHVINARQKPGMILGNFGDYHPKHD